MMKYLAQSLLIAVAFVAMESSVMSAEIRWTAVGLDGLIVPDASIEVISGGVIIAAGDSTPGAQQNLLQVPDSRLRGSNTVIIRIKAIGREEVSLVNMLGVANQVIGVVLPQVYRAPNIEPCKPTCPPCRRWCGKHRWRR